MTSRELEGWYDDPRPCSPSMFAQNSGDKGVDWLSHVWDVTGLGNMSVSGSHNGRGLPYSVRMKE